MAQETMKLIFYGADGALLDTPAVQPSMTVPLGTQTPSMDWGLYLVVVHGAGMTPTQYVQSLPGSLLASLGANATSSIGTIAQTGTETFTFVPEIVSLPTRGDGNESVTTGSNLPWNYDPVLNLKFERKPRLGSLAIEKSLTRYMADAPATFVFSIDAFESEAAAANPANAVYSNVVAITFDAPGTRQELIEEKIPVGSYVVVREVYAGANYTASGNVVATATITNANSAVTVSFANDYDGTIKQGGSIVNSFEFGESGWNWLNGPSEQEGGR